MTTLTMDMISMSSLLDSRVPLSSQPKTTPSVSLDGNRDKVEIGGLNKDSGESDRLILDEKVTLKEISSEIVSPLSDTPTFNKSPESKIATRGTQSLLNKSWMRPALISAGVGIVVISGLVIGFSGNTKPVAKDNATVNVPIETDADGKDQLNVEQAQFLAQRQKDEAEANAKQGVTNAAIVTQLSASAPQNTYVADGTSNVAAITTERKDIAMTMAQLEADPNRYSKTITDDNKIYFTDRSNNSIIYPSDAAVQENALRMAAANKNNPASANTNSTATTYTANNGNGTGGNSNGNGGSDSGGNGSNGGNNSVQATGNDQDQSKNDPDLDNSKQMLYNDYEARTQANQAYQDQINQQQQAFAAQQQQVLAQRQQQAAATINSIVQQRNQQNAQNAFTAQNYYRTANQNTRTGVVNTNNNGNADSAMVQLYDANGNPVQVPASQIGNNANQSNTATSSGATSVGGVGNFNYTDNNVTLSPNGELSNQATQKSVGNQGSSSGSAGGAKNGVTGLTSNGLLPVSVMRAGTTWQMVVTNSVNTDEGLQVIGQLVTGKFAGSRIYGYAVQQGRSVGVVFNQIVPPNPRKPLIPISAMATTIGSEKPAVATSKNSHYVQNYGVMIATSAISGYGDAYANTGTTVIQQSDGTVITAKDKDVDKEQVTGEILSKVGQQLSSDISKLGNRPPTFKIAQGTVLNVTLLQNLDINSTTDSLSIAGVSSGMRNSTR